MPYDISVPLSARTPVYPGDAVPEIRRVSDIEAGDPLTASHLSMGCHVGTHVDAPSHFLAGRASLEELPLSSFHGPALVLDLRRRRVIDEDDLPPLPDDHHLLLRTDNSELLLSESYTEARCHLTEKAAERLRSLRPRSVGFDHYSLDAPGTGEHPAHRVLAEDDIPVFVCLDLSGVPPGRYRFVGLPLRLVGAEAAPARAILLDA
jgi:arylformamidase